MINTTRFSQPIAYESRDIESEAERHQEMADQRRDDDIDRQMNNAEQQAAVMDKLLKQIVP